MKSGEEDYGGHNLDFHSSFALRTNLDNAVIQPVNNRSANSNAGEQTRKCQNEYRGASKNPKLLGAMEKIEGNGDAYIQRLAEYCNGNSGMFGRTFEVSADCQSDSAILSRIATRNDCDLELMSCTVPYCGLSFDSLQVLAWHKSYAHQDMSDARGNAACLLCGVTMSCARGKLTHLSSKHRDIALLHNAQCLNQRAAVISPGTPAAERLQPKRFTDYDRFSFR